MPIIAASALEQFPAVNLRLDGGAIGGPVVVPQCAQIVIRWTLESGKRGASVLYGRYAGAFAGTPAQAQAIFNALSAAGPWGALAAFISTTNGIAAVEIRDVNTPNQAITQNTAGSANGISTSPALPNEVAVVITERTAFTGRMNRGRIYVPGWATNALSAGNLIAAGAVTALNDWAQTIPTALSANGYTLVIGQKARQAYVGKTGTSHPARPAGSVPVTSLVVRDNHWDTQRRRGLK